MTKVKIVKHLTDKGWPVHNKKYNYAHQKANEAEKKHDPIEFKKSLKLMRKMDKHELMSKHTKSGMVEIQRKFSKPKRLKKDLVIHEVVEHKKEIKRNKNEKK